MRRPFLSRLKQCFTALPSHAAAKEVAMESAIAQGESKLGDFTANGRLLWLSVLALLVGLLCALIAIVLLGLIGFFTNLFFYGHLSFAFNSPADNTLGAWEILVPAGGGLIIGLMARYGSERIRGHGIPEAMEAILIGQSRIQPRVAILKPLSSAISIGSGGPFGAAGPIIMTGGAAGGRTAAVRVETAQHDPGGGCQRGGGHPAGCADRPWPALSYWTPSDDVYHRAAALPAGWSDCGRVRVSADGGGLCRRGCISPPAHPLDVVAGNRRGCRWHRRLLLSPYARRWL